MKGKKIEHVYNYNFSQKIFVRKLIILTICMLLGIFIAIWQMKGLISHTIIFISVLFTMVIALLIFYFILYKTWHKDRSDYLLNIDDKNIKIVDIHGKHTFNVALQLQRSIYYILG